jgi:arabinogalactan oligomer/maltooligosaccharide transport system permease protein
MFNEHGFVNQVLIDVGVYEFFQNLGILGVDYESLSGLRKIFYLGPENIQWFKNPFNPNFVRATLIVVNIWLGFPYFMALMTSVMTAIDKTLYEAADIDGATRWQKN